MTFRIIELDGRPLNYTTGELYEGIIWNWSASSKESIHVNMLTKAVAGDPHACLFVNNVNPGIIGTIELFSYFIFNTTTK